MKRPTKSMMFAGFSFLFPLIISAQIHYSGDIHVEKMIRISDQSGINLPFRMGEFGLSYTYHSFDLITESEAEYRWDTGELEVDLHEVYLAWYPSWGEVKVGKQIHAWGAADGNNPTDNLNPYNYYYMFLAGADRKIGTLSASVKTYWRNWQVEAVVIPEHHPNLLPFGETDFPIDMPMEPESYEPVTREVEFGFRAQTSIFESDISVSYFNGHDRGFSPVQKRVVPKSVLDGSETPDFSMGFEIPSLFGYRNTQVFGLDFVTFINDFTLRGEGAYFSTEAKAKDIESFYTSSLLNHVPISMTADYIQFVFQAEWTSSFDVMFSGQMIGSHTVNVSDNSESLEADWMMIEGAGIFVPFNLEDNFHPGMGTPFAMLSDLGAMLSAKAALFDGRLDLTTNGFYDLEESGLMIGGEVSYSPVENMNLTARLSRFAGKEGSHFYDMEDFSHVSLGATYSF